MNGQIKRRIVDCMADSRVMVNELLPEKRRPGRTGKESGVIEVTRGSTTVKIYEVQNRQRTIFMVTWYIGGHRHRRNFSSEKTARKEAAAIPQAHQHRI